MLICNCGKELKNKNGFLEHIKYCKLTSDDIKNIKNDYVLNLLSLNKLIIKYNISKSRLLKILKGKLRNLSEATKIAHQKYPNSFKHTDESKQKMRESRLKFMKNNPEKTAWRKANLSYPESLFLNKINELKWNEKYLIVREKSIFPYFIDFAFENQKLAIEIDGKQHENIDRKLSDNKKDELLNSDGWIVLRFTANKIKFEIDNCINIIKSFLKEQDSEVGVYSYSEHKKIKKESEITEFGFSIKQRNDQLRQRKIERPSLDQLLKEVSELGYSATGRKYNVSDNSIRKWIKMYQKHGEEF